jgi:predicted metal-dependent enzyme (double-stranded beta helix superfamily)
MPKSFGSKNFNECVYSLQQIDWERMSEVYDVTRYVLFQLADRRKLLLSLAQSLETDNTLFSQCEADDFSDRLVLYADPRRRFSIRLNFRASTNHHQPHNHRASFAALIMSGKYKHALYGGANLLTEDGENLPTPQAIQDLSPIVVREERVGDMYCLHHSAFHSTMAAHNHVSLVIKGPAAKDRLLILDVHNQRGKWLYSRESIRSAATTQNLMTHDRLSSLLLRLARIL